MNAHQQTKTYIHIKELYKFGIASGSEKSRTFNQITPDAREKGEKGKAIHTMERDFLRIMLQRSSNSDDGNCNLIK